MEGLVAYELELKDEKARKNAMSRDKADIYTNATEFDTRIGDSVSCDGKAY